MGDCTQRRRPAAASRGGVSFPKKASASAISRTAASSSATFTTDMGRAASTILRSRSDSTAGKISIFMTAPQRYHPETSLKLEKSDSRHHGRTSATSPIRSLSLVGRWRRLRSSSNVSLENSSTPFTARTASKTARGRPWGRSAALIRTLVSRTTRSAFIGQKRFELGLCQAVPGCLLAQVSSMVTVRRSQATPRSRS